jgi:uncharacterized membrane protein YfcA
VYPLAAIARGRRRCDEAALPALSYPELALLAAMLAAGFFVEAVAGFGGTVLAVSLGATRWPIATVLAVFLPLNLLLSAYLATRHRRAVAGGALARRIIPAMAGGHGRRHRAGAGGDRRSRQARLRDPGDRGGAARAGPAGPARRDRGHRRAAAPPIATAVLLAAGVIHGWFATGGPLVVAVAARMFPAKATLRATLAVLWFTLNLVVLGRLIAHGDLTTTTLAYSAAILPALAAALALGEWVHHRVSERGFRWLVAGLLLVTGAVLFARTV